MRVCVTGGAGYIGSHTVKALGRAGHEVLVIDNLSTGRKDAVLYGRLVVADLADKEGLVKILKDFRPSAIMHFAASISVEESVRYPLKYYRNNTANTLNLLEAMSETGINLLVFSSSAAVYGMAVEVPIKETSPLSPINPYGHSKAAVEAMLQNLRASSDFRYVSLRYFNAAGADPEGQIGECHDPETHLIPLVLRAAKQHATVKVFGTDYPTRDGTCVRDYVHVEDIASAHIVALEHLVSGGIGGVFNIGYGQGYTVKEVIETARKITNSELKEQHLPRRPGDPAELVADASAIKQILGWRPRYNTLDSIISTAWRWENRQ